MNHVCRPAILVVMVLGLCAARARAADPLVHYSGGDGAGKGKRVVFVTGDDEYRSEESMPMIARILARHHGFDCTVLFAINPQTGNIDPDTHDNIPGLEALDRADLMVIFTRFRALPEGQMRHVLTYINAGKPVIGIRTATHAFDYPKSSPLYKWSWNNPETHGFGRTVLGETWVAHYGEHMHESTRGTIVASRKDEPIVRGVQDIWGEADVYAVNKLSGDSNPLVMGQPLLGMNPADPPNTRKAPVPVAWTKTYTGGDAKLARVFTTTMGGSFDFKNEGLRRLVVNACYWAVGLEDQIPPSSNVQITGPYDPNQVGFHGFKKELKPQDFQNERATR